MKRRTSLATAAFALATVFFFFTPVISRNPGSVACVPQPTYASLSYVAFGGFGVLY